MAGRIFLDQRIRVEKAVLGAMLVSPDAFRAAIRSLEERDFQVYGHRTIFQSMRALYASRQVVDIVTVTDSLRGMRQLRLVGGPGAISRLLDYASFVAPIDYYARVLKGAS